MVYERQDPSKGYQSRIHHFQLYKYFILYEMNILEIWKLMISNYGVVRPKQESGSDTVPVASGARHHSFYPIKLPHFASFVSFKVE